MQGELPEKFNRRYDEGFAFDFRQGNRYRTNTTRRYYFLPASLQTELKSTPEGTECEHKLTKDNQPGEQLIRAAR